MRLKTKAGYEVAFRTETSEGPFASNPNRLVYV
jgi:hypothetical protein